MRELKFRCWDKQDNIWITSNYLECYSESPYNPIGTLVCLYDWENADRFVIQQYTGIKDSKGNEVYEGDIIKFYREDVFYEVRYVDEYTAFTVLLHNPKQIKGLEMYDHMVDIGYTSDKEVIGNIFENSELIS